MVIGERLLLSGFVSNVKDYNPKNNWNGVSLFTSGRR